MSKWVGFVMAAYLVLVLHAVSPRASAQSATAGVSPSSAASPTLDYEFFKSQVEPIFLKKRVTHARCYVCHEGANHALKLAKLSPGNMKWRPGGGGAYSLGRGNLKAAKRGDLAQSSPGGTTVEGG
jgi:hypothetical protein